MAAPRSSRASLIIIASSGLAHGQSPNRQSAYPSLYPELKDEQAILPEGPLGSLRTPWVATDELGVRYPQDDLEARYEWLKRRYPGWEDGLFPTGPEFSPRDLASQVPPGLQSVSGPNIPPPTLGGSDRIAIAPSHGSTQVNNGCSEALEDYFPLAEQPVVNDPADLVVINAMMDLCLWCWVATAHTLRTFAATNRHYIGCHH